MKSSLWPVWGLALSSAVAVLLACTEPPPPKAPQKKVGATTDFDPCEGSKPPWREYFGPLKGVRCEQEQFLRMADVARQLDVKCQHCHVPDPQKEDAFIYSDMTENKEKALWMHHSLMTGLRRKDGEPMKCKSCHLDKNGKPAAKFLGSPRDLAFTVEWMTTVMTRQFELADGGKLMCKSCHVGGWGTQAFDPKVIGKTVNVPRSPDADAIEPAPLPSSTPTDTSASPAASAAPSASAPPPLTIPAASAAAPSAKPLATPSPTKK